MSVAELNVVIRVIDEASAKLKGIISNSTDQVKKLGEVSDKAYQSNQKSVDKLNKSIEYYKKQNDTLGTSLSLVKAELNTFNRALAEGVQLTDEQKLRYENLKRQLEVLSQSTLKEVASEFKKLGKEISQVGGYISILGGAITTIFVKALNDSKEKSITVSQSLNTLGAEFSRLQRVIAEAVIPIVDKFSNVMKEVNNAVDRIPKPLRDTILQITLLTGVFLTLGGAVTFIIGKLFSLGGDILSLGKKISTINPLFLATIAIIGSLIFLMFKFGDTTKAVLNGLQSFFLALQEGFLKIKSALEDFVASGLENLSVLYDKLSGLPGPLKEFYQQAAISTLEASNSLRKLSNEDLVNAEIAAIKLREIMQGQNGEWAQGFEGVRQKIEEVIKWIENLGTTTPAKISPMREAIENLKTKAKELGDTIQKGIGDAFAQMIVNGKNFGESMKSLFKSVAETFIAEVGRMIAKWLAFLALKAIGKFFGFSEGTGEVKAFNQGGIVQGYSQGTPFVNPLKLAGGTDTIPALLSPGEIVVPRTISDSIRQGDLSLSGPKEKAGDNFGDVNVNIYYPKMTSKEEMTELVNNIGFEIQKQMRYARG